MFHFYFDQQTGENNQIIQESKTFYFFVDYSIIDAKLFFLYNSIIVTWCIQKRDEPSLHAWQDQLISGNVSATLEHFYFD